MSYFIDVAYDNLNKKDEELCGDKVEIVKGEKNIIIVLSDGLGSGVKANILSTLTSKIAVTMLKEGSSLIETIKTISNTLPVCNVRKLAYSTFTIVKITEDGFVYIAEYDNPPYFFVKNKKIIHNSKRDIIIDNKVIKESKFKLEKDDLLTIVSDGVIHAGVGKTLNLGWQWENVADYIQSMSKIKKTAKSISKELICVCDNLYANRPGDDTTAIAIKVKDPEYISLFTGPPENKDNDSNTVIKFMQSKGKKIICGGTASKIVAREIKSDLNVKLDTMSIDVPPIAEIKGIDLATEGVLTLSKTVEKIKSFIDPNNNVNQNRLFNNKDGASMLADNLINNCTHLNLWVGKAINPAHQNPNLPIDLSIKLKVVDELIMLMRKLGKKVSINHI
ncbi:SpoIIE family protein phosphatase [Senegalia massiliensis]|uniref:Serine/threonine-protein phosphatase n=1 Tax=Senegalia massiliensis TaxID=1720316 RepID=A0A845QT32_9CLOT|nr:SpoIIE family protein phosphatase [Senegalia massiliensis]NBI05371.1 serine/threonine-protein phosphatase [Senegalia massiliensis]